MVRIYVSILACILISLNLLVLIALFIRFQKVITLFKESAIKVRNIEIILYKLNSKVDCFIIDKNVQSKNESEDIIIFDD